MRLQLGIVFFTLLFFCCKANRVETKEHPTKVRICSQKNIDEARLSDSLNEISIFCDLSVQEWESIWELVKQKKKIKTLQIISVDLDSQFFDNLEKNPFITTLDLVNCTIEGNEGEYDLTKLNRLFVEGGNANLTFLLGNKFNLNFLRLISLELDTLPPQLERMDYLEKLTLESNNLSQLPLWMKKWRNLTAISLADNNFTQRVAFLYYLPNIKFIDFEGNPLGIPTEEVEEAIGHFSERRKKMGH